MWIQVRTMDGKETHRIDSLSKLTKVDDLRVKILELFKVEPDRQRLFYRGKQVRLKRGPFQSCQDDSIRIRHWKSSCFGLLYVGL